MLDKELCKIFKVPPYLEWIQNQLDDLEDGIYSGQLDPETLTRFKIRYDALVEARDTYCEMRKMEVTKMK